MPATIQQKIIDGVEAALQGISGLTGGVFQERQDPFSKAETDAINIEFTNAAAVQSTIEWTKWQLLVRVNIVVRGMSPSKIASTYQQAVHSRVIALGLTNAFDIPNMVLYVEPQSVTPNSVGGGDGPVGALSCDYLFHFRTSYTDLTATG